MAKKILEIKNLHVNFRVHAGTVQAIRGIDLQIREGEIVSLVGESGSGKSVTAKSIMGLLPESNTFISEGKIVVDGIDVTEFSDSDFSQIRGKIAAMIFQDPMTSLNPVISIGKQILEAVNLHQPHLNKEESYERVVEYLELVGINEPESMYKQFPHQLSGGMRQRIVIAIALACEPKLLLCDEPTTALDVTIQAQILELIKDLQKKLGFAVLFITHDLGVVANVSDYVAVMYAGKIVEKGLVDEIFYNPQHPYTWGLLASMPDLDSDGDKPLYNIPGTPPNLLNPPVGDAFARRSEFALEIDFVEEPPLTNVSKTHEVYSWLLDERAPDVKKPDIVIERMKKYKELKGGK